MYVSVIWHLLLLSIAGIHGYQLSRQLFIMGSSQDGTQYVVTTCAIFKRLDFHYS